MFINNGCENFKLQSTYSGEKIRHCEKRRKEIIIRENTKKRYKSTIIKRKTMLKAFANQQVKKKQLIS